MRRALFLAVLFCIACPTAFTQDSPSALAEREDAQVRYKRLTAKIEDLENTIQAYNQQFQKMEAEIHRLRSEVSKMRDGGSDSSAMAEIRRVDKAREADHDTVMKEFARLRKELLGAVKAPKSNSGSPAPVPQATEKGLEYSIREGDTLAKLVVTLNKQGVKVTQKQIEQANPGVDWNRLQIGRKIFIPQN
jgi:septal ring factor EnvC (AmiA/AmiB activator)